MLRCSILYVFSLTVGFVAASYIDDVGQCFDTCTMRATSVAGCSLKCVYFHPSVGRPPLWVNVVLLFQPY